MMDADAKLLVTVKIAILLQIDLDDLGHDENVAPSNGLQCPDEGHPPALTSMELKHSYKSSQTVVSPVC